MSPDSLRSLDVFSLVSSALRTTEDQTERYLAALRNPQFTSSVTRAVVFTISDRVEGRWPRVLQKLPNSIRHWKLTATPTGRT